MTRCTIPIHPESPSNEPLLDGLSHAIQTLGDRDENANYEAGRQFRHAVATLESENAESETADGLLYLTGPNPTLTARDVGYEVERVLQMEGSVRLTFDSHDDSLYVTVQRGRLSRHPSIEFSASRDDRQAARTLVTDLYAYGSEDRQLPRDGLVLGIRRRHDRVRIATNALHSDHPRTRKRFPTIRRFLRQLSGLTP